MKNNSSSPSRFQTTSCLAALVMVALAATVVDSPATIVQQAFFEGSEPRAHDQFGWSTAIAGDTAVVGAPYAFGDGSGSARAGTAYVFVRHGTNWTLQASLKASNGDSNDWFGYSVAISGDTIVVGAVSESSSATNVNGDQSDNS